MNARRVLFATPEIFPFVKTGGLGDVAASLPPALAAAGIDIRIIVPGYAEITGALQDAKILHTFDDLYGGRDARLLRGTLAGFQAYVLESPQFFSGRRGPYVDAGGKDWPDNHLRFAAFCRVAAELDLHDPLWTAEIIHGNDWPCGLIPAFCAARGRSPARNVFTIHNLAYQGLFSAEIFPQLKLPPSYFTHTGMEFWGHVSYLKAALIHADHVTTVSPTYAQEIQTAEFGCGLDGLLRERKDSLTGILNGVDRDAWNPAADPHVKFPYASDLLEAKRKNKHELLKEFGLAQGKGMLFGVVSRLTEQKGLDLLLAALPAFLEHEDVKVVVLGAGDKPLEEAISSLAKTYPSRVGVRLGYDEGLAHRIQAGADSIIVPSRFEPCGLVQMYALRYGSPPVVRETGGLADTVIEGETGFLFARSEAGNLLRALRRAHKAYHSPDQWAQMQRDGMEQVFSWDGAAKEYAKIYDRLIPA